MTVVLNGPGRVRGEGEAGARRVAHRPEHPDRVAVETHLRIAHPPDQPGL